MRRRHCRIMHAGATAGLCTQAPLLGYMQAPLPDHARSRHCQIMHAGATAGLHAGATVGSCRRTQVQAQAARRTHQPRALCAQQGIHVHERGAECQKGVDGKHLLRQLLPQHLHIRGKALAQEGVVEQGGWPEPNSGLRAQCGGGLGARTFQFELLRACWPVGGARTSRCAVLRVC